MRILLGGVRRILRGESFFQRHVSPHIHELIVHFHVIPMLPDLYRRRRRVHHTRHAGGFALEVRIVLLIIVRGAFLFALGRQLRLFNVRAEQDPDTIHVGALAGGRNKQRKTSDNCSNLHFAFSSQPPLPFTMPWRNAAKPQSRITVPSGSVAVRKYPRLGRRLLGLTLIVTLSPTLILFTGTLRRSKAFLSD